jgi:multiple sugar transport system ATP-binding protein
MIYVTHDQIEALTLADRIAIMKSGIIQQLADPTTIYNRPKNLFVAGFIGSPSMNFLKGTIEPGEGAPVVNSNGVRIPLDGYHAESELTRGRKVILGVRPEHIGVDEAAAARTFDAMVNIEEPMGADNLLWVEFAGQSKVGVRIAGARRYAVGSKVRLSFDMGLASLFDQETELRI